MTPEELKEKMQQLVDGTLPDDPGGLRPKWSDDEERGHSKADALMVAVLRELGYGEAMDIYEAQTRWCG